MTAASSDCALAVSFGLADELYLIHLVHTIYNHSLSVHWCNASARTGAQTHRIFMRRSAVVAVVFVLSLVWQSQVGKYDARAEGRRDDAYLDVMSRLTRGLDLETTV